MRNLPVKIILLFAFLVLNSPAYAAPCYGTHLPEKNKFSVGLENYSLFKRYLENEQGKVRSQQEFLIVSYGVFDWLSIDLKGGAGYIKQEPVGSDRIDYRTNFAGGYGFRLKFYDKEKIKMVFGFQHISIHPKSTHVASVKNKAVLDDWQVSLLASYSFSKLTPYLGTRWSRVDYIHWVSDSRKRVMSDMTKDIGLIVGCDVPLVKNIRANIEGQFLDSEAFAFSLNYDF